MTDASMVERVARAICGNSLGGYCEFVGGDLGCKVGRGESFNGKNCVATRDALQLSEHWREARAAIEAMREPTDAMEAAGERFHFPENTWQAMIDAALKE